jgi:AdoMet-dependent heme synthase
MVEEHGPGTIINPRLNLVAWEITRSCNWRCAPCRAAPVDSRTPDELSTEDCYRFIDGILEIGKPILILTGGEPLARPDVFDIAKYAVSKGLKVVMGSNGTLITHEIANKLKSIPISRIAVSLDFPVPALQDKFRGQPGAFEKAMSGISAIKRAGIELQINCTLTRQNISHLERLLGMALEFGAVAFHPFFLVPTGRGKGLGEDELSSEEYEKTLNWIYDRQMELGDRIFFKPTDAPHYLRIMKQREVGETGFGKTVAKSMNPAHAVTRGCLAGTGFCFVSHTGVVQGCGYLDVAAGNVRNQPFNEIWASSPLFKSLRNLSNIKGKCGDCEYKKICGGCRARAFESTGDFLEAEPYCLHQPYKCEKVR